MSSRLVPPSSDEPDPGPGTAAGLEVRDDFERFNQRDDIFCRSFWDPTIHSDATDRFYATYREALANWRATDGFTQRDYALRNASWHVTDVFAELKEGEDRREGYLDELTVLRDAPAEKVEHDSPAAAATEIKRVAKLFGADLVGITDYDERWLYTHKYSRARENSKPNDQPAGLTHVIVVAKAMDHGLIDTVPSALSGAATGWGYSEDTLTLLALSQYIRNLGYQAVPNLNDTALAIPYAIKAGLGEYGKLGLVITPEYGPRVRFAKIFTDLPMALDAPRTFGVREFCDTCDLCVKACPVGAIAGGEPSAEVFNRSNIVGVKKWSVDAEKCFGFWERQNSDCSICIRVCPYNNGWPAWAFAAWRWLAATPLRRVALWIDRLVGGGRRRPAASWWKQR
jgi:ferredoxin